MAQFADSTPVDPTTMTLSETKAVKKEASEPLQQTGGDLTYSQPEVIHKS